MLVNMLARGLRIHYSDHNFVSRAYWCAVLCKVIWYEWNSILKAVAPSMSCATCFPFWLRNILVEKWFLLLIISHNTLYYVYNARWEILPSMRKNKLGAFYGNFSTVSAFIFLHFNSKLKRMLLNNGHQHITLSNPPLSETTRNHKIVANREEITQSNISHPR